jgi:SAM-dependent methyltransferase
VGIGSPEGTGAGEGYGATFADRSRRYDDAMRRWPAARAEEFAFALDLAELSPGEVVVDIPSGGGYLADHVPDGVRIIAAETVPAFVERCRERGIEACHVDLADPVVPDAPVDVVISVTGLHHEPHQVELLRAWAGLLRPGGRLVALDVIAGSPEASFLDGFVGAHLADGHVGRYLDADAGGLLVAAGLEQVRVADRRYRWWGQSPDDLASFCAGLFGLADTPVAEVRDALAAGPGLEVGPDGRCGLRWGLRSLVGVRPGA